MDAWCGLCSQYTDHDTVHHGAPSGFVPGDLVRGDGERIGRIEEVRGQRARVGWRGKTGKTETEWVGLDGLTLVD